MSYCRHWWLIFAVTVKRASSMRCSNRTLALITIFLAHGFTAISSLAFFRIYIIFDWHFRDNVDITVPPLMILPSFLQPRCNNKASKHHDWYYYMPDGIYAQLYQNHMPIILALMMTPQACFLSFSSWHLLMILSPSLHITHLFIMLPMQTPAIFSCLSCTIGHASNNTLVGDTKVSYKYNISEMHNYSYW